MAKPIGPKKVHRYSDAREYGVRSRNHTGPGGCNRRDGTGSIPTRKTVGLHDLTPYGVASHRLTRVMSRGSAIRRGSHNV